MSYIIAAAFLGASIGALLWGTAGSIVFMILAAAIMYWARPNETRTDRKPMMSAKQTAPREPLKTTTSDPIATSMIISMPSLTRANTSYSINEIDLSCSCPDFQKSRSYFAADDPRKLCKHVIKFLCENQQQHQFELFKEKLDWCYEKERGFPLFGEQFKSADNEFEIVGFMPSENQWNFNSEGFWIELYYKNTRFAFNPVFQTWTRNRKILTDDVNMEKAILQQILPNYPAWRKYQRQLDRA